MKFKLTFQLNFDDEVSGDSVKSNHYIVVIEAETPETACKMGEAMIGRQVYEREWITDLISVEETAETAEALPVNEDGQFAFY